MACDNNACKWCQGGSCANKFDESAPAGAFQFMTTSVSSEFKKIFKADGVTSYKPKTDRVLRTQADVAEWKFDFLAYCNAGGFWKFKVKRADIIIKAYVNLVLSVPEIDLPVVSNFSNCRILNVAEYGVHLGAFPASIQNTVGLCLGEGAPNPPDWIPGQEYRSFEEIRAHENVHVARITALFQDKSVFAEFKNRVEEIQIPIEENDSPEKAIERFKREELKDIEDAFIVFLDPLVDTDGSGGHHIPENFYEAMMCVEKTLQWIQYIDSRRSIQTPPCAIERHICPTPQCLN